MLDRRLPDGDGLTLLAELKARCRPAPSCVMVTAHGDIASAVDAIRAGAADYVAKPVELSDLVLRVQRCVGRGAHARPARPAPRRSSSGRHRLVPPRSPAMQVVLAMLERIATTPRSPVLLLGRDRRRQGGARARPAPRWRPARRRRSST